MALLKKDVRSAHFQFGNSETNYLSNNARTMVQHQIPRDSGNHRKEAKEKMQTANFCLEAKPDSSPVKTTNDHYLGAADDKEAWENCRAQVQPRNHKSNVVITNNSGYLRCRLDLFDRLERRFFFFSKFLKSTGKAVVQLSTIDVR